MHPREIERQLPKFEGLTFTTAALIVNIGRQAGIAGVELDLEEIQQRIRLKVWYALRSYRRELSGGRGDERLKSYVFSCVVNEKKDIFKSWQTATARARRRHVYIDDRCFDDGEHDDSFDFEAECLSVEADVVYREIEERLTLHGEAATLPSTLDETERQVVLLLYSGRSRAEIRGILDLSAKRMGEQVKRVQEKLGDWKPSSLPPALASPPPPVAGPSPARRPPREAGRVAMTTHRAAA